MIFFTVMLWAGEVEARDNETKQRVSGSDFDPEKHHFPVWEVERLAVEYGETDSA